MNLVVKPGVGLGPFYLGMSLRECFKTIDEESSKIAKVEVKYGNAGVSSTILLDFVEEGMLLTFKEREQQLVEIVIYRFGRVVLTYQGDTVCSGEVLPTFVQLYGRFGPAKPGLWLDDIGPAEAGDTVYRLDYPGLNIFFSVPKKFRAHFSDDKLPIELPDDTTPLASRLAVFHGKVNEGQLAGPGPGVVGVQARPASLACPGLPPLTAGMSAQAVAMLLGSPDAIFRKFTDKMKIHDSHKAEGLFHEYFYNYVELGFDILFSEETHTVSRFILHTNSPNDALFNHYNKCNFTLTLKGKTITPETPWREIAELGVEGPIVHDAGLSANPFGPTKFYSLENVIFHILPGERLGAISVFTP